MPSHPLQVLKTVVCQISVDVTAVYLPRRHSLKSHQNQQMDMAIGWRSAQVELDFSVASLLIQPFRSFPVLQFLIFPWSDIT